MSAGRWTGAIAAGALLGSIVSCGRSTPTAAQGATRTTTASMVAYIDDGSLWLYDVASDENKRLASPSDDPGGIPRWIENREVTYVGSGDSDSAIIRGIDIESLRRRDIVKESGIIWSHDVSPDGSKIAYLLYGVDGRHHVKVADTGSGVPTELRMLGEIDGRGADSDDEVSIAWSPDGTRLLVTDTHIGALDVYVLDPAGLDVVPPREGTHARWSWDGASIYFRGARSQGDAMQWKRLELATGREVAVPMKEGTNNPSVAPEGGWVAYDDSVFGDVELPASAPTVDLYNVDRASAEVLRRGALAPTWISPTEVLVTDARVPKDQGSMNSWEPTGTVTKISVDGKATRVTMTSTLRATASFTTTGTPDATMSPTSQKALATYVDPWDRFSFEYPSGWEPREPSSRDAAWSIKSYDPVALERGEYPGCSGHHVWCSGVTKIEGWTGDGTDQRTLRNSAKVRISTGQVGQFISWEGDPNDDQYSKSTIEDFERSHLAYVALLYVVDGSTSYQFSIWSGNPQRPGGADPPDEATFDDLISSLTISA